MWRLCHLHLYLSREFDMLKNEPNVLKFEPFHHFRPTLKWTIDFYQKRGGATRKKSMWIFRSCKKKSTTCFFFCKKNSPSDQKKNCSHLLAWFTTVYAVRSRTSALSFVVFFPAKKNLPPTKKIFFTQMWRQPMHSRWRSHIVSLNFA